eukprot:scaffold75035_cov56-Phaeocystis_antarctica.AAC.1
MEGDGSQRTQLRSQCQTIYTYHPDLYAVRSRRGDAVRAERCLWVGRDGPVKRARLTHRRFSLVFTRL